MFGLCPATLLMNQRPIYGIRQEVTDSHPPFVYCKFAVHSVVQLPIIGKCRIQVARPGNAGHAADDSGRLKCRPPGNR